MITWSVEFLSVALVVEKPRAHAAHRQGIQLTAGMPAGLPQPPLLLFFLSLSLSFFIYFFLVSPT